jgi:outer membrane protein
MRRLFSVGLAMILVGAAAQAQTPSPATPPAARQTAPSVPAVPAVPGTKVAVIDFEQAVLESDAGKAATAEFNKEMEPEKGKFEKLEKEVNDLQKKLQDAKTDAEKDPFRRELEAKNKEAQRIQEDAQQKSNDLRQKLLGPIAQLVNRMVDQYAKTNNLAVVFDPNTQPTNIIFASKAAEITAEIIRMMNEEFAKNPKLTAPAASNAPAATAKPNN